jgi:hypothetical protein
VLVVAVTKVTIISTLFSLKEEQDHMRERGCRSRHFRHSFPFETQPGIANTESLKRGRFSPPPFQQPDMSSRQATKDRRW